MAPTPRAIVYSSPFLPPEWIAAHGWTPSRRRPGPASEFEAEGVCRFAAGFAVLAGPDIRARVFATTCDPMRRGAEIGTDDPIPRFLFHMPATWQTPEAHGLYREELKRLGRFLERLGGCAPTPAGLMEQMERFEAARETLLARREILSSRAHAEEMDRFHATGEVPSGAPAVPRPKSAIPLMLLGSPLRADDLHLLDLLDRAGGWVAADATEFGEREWPRRFDRRRMGEDAFDELADAYFGHMPAIFRRPNGRFFEWLADARNRTPVRGIVFAAHPWCDLWRAELPRIREVSALPVLSLHLAGEGNAEGAWTTRIQAFLEMLA
ncbi:MAG: 2-hydroxyacyl-CoA dehydratase [Opitutae bacterium]|nr:2-hydroxyacyl-CoA dehydratase [Opitutae bacterium]